MASTSSQKQRGIKRVAQSMGSASDPMRDDVSDRRVHQPSVRLESVEVRIGTFSAGIEQSQISSRKFEERGLGNFLRTVAKAFEE